MEKWEERLEGVWPGQCHGLPIDTSCFSVHRDYKVGHVATMGTASGSAPRWVWFQKPLQENTFMEAREFDSESKTMPTGENF